MAENETVVDVQTDETEPDDPRAVLDGQDTFLGDPIPMVPDRPTDEVPESVKNAEARERELWALMDLEPERFNELNPQSRMVEMQLAMAEARAVQAPEQQSESETAPENKTTADELPTPTLPAYDRKVLVGNLARAIIDGEEDGISGAIGALADVLDAQNKYIEDVATVFDAALAKQDGTVAALSRPAQVRDALPKVKLAVEDDVGEAVQLLASGKAQDALNAVKLAVMNRLERDGLPKGPKTAAQISREKLRSLQAAAGSTGQTRTKAPKGYIPPRESFNSAEGHKILASL